MKHNSIVLRQDFYNTITKKNIVLDSYNKLVFSHNDKNIFLSKDILNSNNVINISLFPSYMKYILNNAADFKIKKIPQKKIVGYSILLKNSLDIDSLLKTEFKKSFRTNILRYVNRFEYCFSENYKMFYGDISKEDYAFLMDKLHSMLTNRFNQRNDSNKVLKSWNEYRDTTYNLIKEKKASLFVIYQNTAPVHICLNYHFNKILFVSVPSYNTDYAKFALGNISLYKLLEWSINNNYEIMDMAYGYLEYKRRWSNLIYDFEQHIIYPKKDALAAVIAFTEINKLKLKNFLKSKNIDDRIKNIKSKLYKNKHTFNKLLYTTETTKLLNNDYKNISFQTENIEYNFLKKPIFDFLYKHKVHIDQINVFEIYAPKVYIISDKNISEKITFL